MRRRYSKRTRRSSGRSFAIGGSYRGASVNMKYASWQTVQDGEDKTSSFTPTEGLTQGITLMGVADFNTSNPMGSSTSYKAAKVKNLFAEGRLDVDESCAVEFTMHVLIWMMVAPAVVITDWQTNGRAPKDQNIGAVTTANPWKLVSPMKTIIVSNSSNTNQPLDATQGKFTLKARYPVRVKYPDVLALMFQPFLLNDGAGVAASDLALTYNYRMKLARNNEV